MSGSIPFLVNTLSVLQEGDHIKWKRLPGYDHHAIVEHVDHQTGKVHVIEYGSDAGGYSLGKGVVRRSEVDNVKRMYKYKYDKSDDPKQVLERAKSRLNEQKYNPFQQNCEHFATWCKVGEKSCSQILPFVARTGVCGAEGVSTACGTAAGRCVNKCAAEAAINGTKVTTELKSLMTSGGLRNATKQVWNAIKDGGKETGKDTLKSGVISSLGLSVVIEGSFFGYTCYKAHKKYKEGNTEKCKMIQEAACEALGAVAGGTALGAVGAALGTFIPIPGVGTVIGGVVGNAAGRLIGQTCGRFFFN